MNLSRRLLTITSDIFKMSDLWTWAWNSIGNISDNFAMSDLWTRAENNLATISDNFKMSDLWTWTWNGWKYIGQFKKGLSNNFRNLDILQNFFTITIGFYGLFGQLRVEFELERCPNSESYSLILNFSRKLKWLEFRARTHRKCFWAFRKWLRPTGSGSDVGFLYE